MSPKRKGFKLIVRNSVTEDVLSRFDKDSRPVWVSNNPKLWKWFDSQKDADKAMAIVMKCGYECYSVSLDFELSMEK